MCTAAAVLCVFACLWHIVPNKRFKEPRTNRLLTSVSKVTPSATGFYLYDGVNFVFPLHLLLLSSQILFLVRFQEVPKQKQTRDEKLSLCLSKQFFLLEWRQRCFILLYFPLTVFHRSFFFYSYLYVNVIPQGWFLASLSGYQLNRSTQLLREQYYRVLIFITLIRLSPPHVGDRQKHY